MNHAIKTHPLTTQVLTPPPHRSSLSVTCRSEVSQGSTQTTTVSASIAGAGIRLTLMLVLLPVTDGNTAGLEGWGGRDDATSLLSPLFLSAALLVGD